MESELCLWSGCCSWQAGFDPAVDASMQKIGQLPKTYSSAIPSREWLLPILGDRVDCASEIYIAAFTPKIGHSCLDRCLLGEGIFDPAWVDTMA
jgi:hypothetical protein